MALLSFNTYSRGILRKLPKQVLKVLDVIRGFLFFWKVKIMGIDA
jgi:hypothetical protein